MFADRKEQRHVNETMTALLAPLFSHIKEQDEEYVRRGLEELRGVPTKEEGLYALSEEQLVEFAKYMYRTGRSDANSGVTFDPNTLNSPEFREHVYNAVGRCKEGWLNI